MLYLPYNMLCCRHYLTLCPGALYAVPARQETIKCGHFFPTWVPAPPSESFSEANVLVPQVLPFLYTFP
uniref:Uncharacterized protein n=1 Tax=Anguilla anguilla TaxID=7936 RepID=A0A0E9PQI1_ANGAN